MKKRFGLETDIIKGAGGVFEVKMDDRLIFSKKSLGRFPDHGEVEDLVGAALA